MEQQVRRLVTRSDFDGLACAMMLKELNLIDTIKFVHPKDVQDGKIELSKNDITTNLPYDPRVSIAFDHHESEVDRLKATETNGKLEKILEISNLQTAQTIYNAVATKKDDAGENVRYYAAYEGTIKAGIDFSKIVIDHDSDTNTITVTLPPAEILESTVNPGTVEYIFIDKKAETETVAQEAYRLCKEDLQQRAEADKDKLLDVAAENAGNAVEGLIRPWLDPQVQLIIK